MVTTRYRDLLTAAEANLATAQMRRRHPASSDRAAHIPDPLMADLGAALAHLGATHGAANPASQRLLTALRALARMDLDLTRPEVDQLTAAARDVAEATIAVRLAGDLIATHGPSAPDATYRDLAGEWASPRPPHLTTPSARQGSWTQIAELTLLAAGLADTTTGPLTVEALDQATAAARAVPRHEPDPAVQATGPAWPLPLPRGPVPDEWAGRLEELTALSWRMTLPPEPGRAHPIRGLRLIAETAYLLHRQAAADAAAPADRHALRQRADTWRTIHQQLCSIHTPTEPLQPAQEFSLSRLRALAIAPLTEPDLCAGRTALTQAAAWAQATVSHYEGNKLTGLGPGLAPQLKAHVRTLHSTAGRYPRTVPYEHVLLANLNGRPASPIPPGTLDPLAALYQVAAQPVTPPPHPTLADQPLRMAAAPQLPGATPTPRRPPPQGGLRR